MNITVFGANSSIGKHLIDLFIKNNHQVTAFINKPGSIKLPHPSLKIIVGHNYDKSLVRGAIRDADIIINAYKPDFKFFTNRKYYASNISNETIIKEMCNLGKKRFITLSRVTDKKSTSSLFYVYLNKFIYRSYKDEFKLTDKLLKNSSLKWTIVDIIRTFPSKNNKFTYKGRGPFISNANLAKSIYDISVNDLFINEKIIVSNEKAAA